MPELVLRLIEQERITSFFAPPTVWISLLRHPDFATRDLRSLQRSLLRRLDHAGAGAARAARAAAQRAAVQLLWPDRDRAARDHACARGTRRAPGLLRPPGAERGDPRGRSGHERRAAGHAWRDRAPLAASAGRLLEQAAGNRGGLHRRLVSFRRCRVFRRRGLSLHRRSHPRRDQHRRRAGRQPRGGGGAVHPSRGFRGRRGRPAGRQMDRGGDGLRGIARRAARRRRTR